ncbi:TlpA family protein disulfide reductase [Sphingobacterium yanglingense]|uniref:Thiol-disulfide isomerase/thioredoxin n=1 Tax=Sphingobacterium yanglingense TaxID=1437280 RepID=A0A4R6WJN0_9SPHI|nr:TlpA disulfide reductase family protein [Sphingobacterium yanglingense]TDQ77940.1 thiol-disulfide isomerase/thioredoxin [Sphingobacterium yanglingense]
MYRFNPIILILIAYNCLFLTCFAQNINISGKVIHPKDSIITFSQSETHPLTGLKINRSFETKITDNSFEISLPVEIIGSWKITSGSFFWFAFLVPGEDLNLTIDMDMSLKNEDQFRKGIVAFGNNASNFNLIYYLNDGMDQFHQDMRNTINSTSDIQEILKARKEKNAHVIARLNHYHRQSPLTDAYYDYWKTTYTYDSYERTIQEDLLSSNGIKLQDSATLDILTTDVINSDVAVSNPTYMKYVDIYIFYLAASDQPGRDFPIDSLIELGKKELCGLTREAYLTRVMCTYLNKLEEEAYKSYYEQYSKLVTSKKLKMLVDSCRQDFLQKIDVSQNIADYPLLNKTLGKYRGKVLYIDFWASWCGPCRAEMPNAKRLKDSLKGKDVAFIYFGYNDNEQTWMQARNQLKIEGEHFLVDKALEKEVTELFEISGIPHYVIIDKDGTIVNKNANRPKDAYEQLLLLAEK